jgi:hypothetical protein
MIKHCFLYYLHSNAIKECSLCGLGYKRKSCKQKIKSGLFVGHRKAIKYNFEVYLDYPHLTQKLVNRFITMCVRRIGYEI